MHLYKNQTDVDRATNMDDHGRPSRRSSTEEVGIKPLVDRVKSMTSAVNAMKSRTPSVEEIDDRDAADSKEGAAGSGVSPTSSSPVEQVEEEVIDTEPKNFKHGVGLVVKSCEHLSKALYARIRVSVYCSNDPVLNMHQVGYFNNLGVSLDTFRTHCQLCSCL